MSHRNPSESATPASIFLGRHPPPYYGLVGGQKFCVTVVPADEPVLADAEQRLEDETDSSAQSRPHTHSPRMTPLEMTPPGRWRPNHESRK